MSPRPGEDQGSRQGCLVLLTNYFPYFRGEEYLEAELPFLLERFGRVVIVPVMYERGMERTRGLPPGVAVVPVHMPSSWGARIGHLVTNGATATASGLMRDAAPPWRPLRFLLDLYFTTRSLEFWKRARVAVLEAIGESDDVVIYSYWLFVTAFEAVLLRRELGSRARVAVSRAHRYDVVKEANALRFLPQRRLLVSELDRVHPVSETGRVSLLDDVPDLAAKVSVRRLGVAEPLGVGPRANRPQLELLSCSSLKPVKRVPLLIDALAELQARRIPFHWTHFGGSGPALDDLRDRAARSLTAGSFTITGHLANQDVLDHYARFPASVFLNVSESEGVPVSIMEAMAHGVPALATSAGDTGQLVTAGHDGWLLPVASSAAVIADTLQDVWRLPPEEYARFSANARQTWATGWATTTIYPEFTAELADVIAS
jgi:glycosyltransferase involved in cell wall biosynthesis